MVTLVCGMPGTGKSTYVKQHIGDGVAYDLDALAAAFRLKEPHEEYHDAARHMANDLLKGFVKKAAEYSSDIWVIRTAPTLQEVKDINPLRVVICMVRYVKRPCGETTRRKLMELAEWCECNGISLEYMPRKN